ncbi:MAG: GNAT family N-acetyltransferase [Bacteroidetes bacterium]|nr:GNAT family N-acetyltransferase [Bacteroidota bacterium]
MDKQTLKHSDINFIADLLPPGWEGSIPTINFYTNSNFCFPIKVTINKKIVGIGTTIIHNDIAWLAHIIVHLEYRNQSIGKLITQTLVESSISKCCDTIYLLATALGEPVYKKVGFETETQYLYFKGEKNIGALMNSGNIVAFKQDFKKQISNLDFQVSGEDRMFQIEQHLSSGYVYLQEKHVQGFYLPDLGDVLIMANTKLAGQELMKLRITTKDFAVFPIDNVSAIEFMHQNNFQQKRIEKRMRLGRKRNWQPTNIYNRIGGNLG